jgi:pimeloyl-ACP methyl ester carboxylesterase
VDRGRRLNIYCSGQGSPVVIFESGQGDDFSAWGLVQPIVEAKTKTCAYDRAGLGYSDPINRPNTAANFSDDLHRLLVAAAIKPPYILVGQSLGGMYVRLYADLHPSEVVGLVLVDPSNEEQRIGYRKISDHQRTPDEWNAYMSDHYAKRRECIRAAPAGFSPSTLIYKQCVEEPDKHFNEQINNALNLRRIRAEYLEADLSEQENMFDGIYRVIPNSTHQIQMDQPRAVSGAIFEVLAQAEQRINLTH